jgi:hypothetical protein
MHQPKGSQLEIGLSHGGDRHARVGNLLITACSNGSTGALNVLAKSVDVRGLKRRRSVKEVMPWSATMLLATTWLNPR